MGIETEANLLGGTSYELPRDGSLADLPSEVSAVVGDFERDVFANAKADVALLAAKCLYPPMRRWLEVLAACSPPDLVVHCADIEQADRTVSIREVFLRFFHSGLVRIFDVQFRKDTNLEVIHPALRSVFEHVARIEVSEWMAAGGQLGYDEGQSGLMDRIGFDEEADRIMAGRTRHLYLGRSGYSIGCRDDGIAVRYKPCRLIEVGPVEDVLEAYLDLLIGDEESFHKIAFTEEIVALAEARRAGPGRDTPHPAPAFARDEPWR